MLQPIDGNLVYKFVGKNINTSDLPTEDIGSGSEAYDVITGKTYIFVASDSSWNEKV